MPTPTATPLMKTARTESPARQRPDCPIVGIGASPAAPAGSKREESSGNAGLEQDLAETRDCLQSIREQQESANEELQAVNEEMVTRNTELNRLNSDLTNLQTSTKLAILLLGRDLAIRRFSVQAEKLFHLRAGDLGRPLGGLQHDLDLPDLEDLITEVITSGRECEREARTRDGHWYSLHIRPYLTVDNKVDGAVLVLVDIDASKRADHAVVSARDFAEAVISTVRDPLLILDAAFRVQKANEAYLTTFKVPYKALANRPVFALNAGSWNLPGLRTLLQDILPRNSSFDNFEVSHDFKGLGRRTLLLNARMLSQDPGHREKILLGFQDITARKQAEEAQRQSEERYRLLFDSMDQGYCVIELIYNRRRRPVDWRFLTVNPSFAKHSGLKGASGKRMSELAPALEPNWYNAYNRVVRTGKPVRFVSEARALGRWFDLYAFRVGGPGSHKVAVLFSNITARKHAEEALAKAEVLLSRHAGQLEKTVGRRTAQLTTSNRQLAASLDSTRLGEEQNRVLLLESQVMQKKLRQLTHQILTAQEEERKKISRELHDEVVQTLVGLNVELSALVHGNSAGVRRLKDKIARTQRLVEKSVDAVHRFARDLRPAVLDDLGLIPALHAFCKELAARKKFKIHLTAFAGIEALASEKRTVLYRVAQEALTNVARHARAKLARVIIEAAPGKAVRMDIIDNGKSFPVRKIFLAKTNKRLGLVGMKERVEMVGGTLTIDSAPGKGTTVHVTIPFQPEKTKP